MRVRGVQICVCARRIDSFSLISAAAPSTVSTTPLRASGPSWAIAYAWDFHDSRPSTPAPTLKSVFWMSNAAFFNGKKGMLVIDEFDELESLTTTS
jgi:hypothetical protein